MIYFKWETMAINLDLAGKTVDEAVTTAMFKMDFGRTRNPLEWRSGYDAWCADDEKLLAPTDVLENECFVEIRPNERVKKRRETLDTIRNLKKVLKNTPIWKVKDRRDTRLRIKTLEHTVGKD